MSSVFFCVLIRNPISVTHAQTWILRPYSGRMTTRGGGGQQTFWYQDVFFYVRTHFLTSWCILALIHDILLTSWFIFDIGTYLWWHDELLAEFVWRHDITLTSIRTFWHHDKLVDVRTYFGIWDVFLKSWCDVEVLTYSTFWCNFYVMTNFLMSWHIFDVIM